MDDDIGTTSILCHSDKGKKLLEQPDVIDKMRIKSVDSEELILTEGSMLIASAKKSENREAFFHDRELMTYEQLTNKYAPITSEKNLPVPVLLFCDSFRPFGFPW